MYGIAIQLKQSEIRKRSIKLKEDLIIEYTQYRSGASLDAQLFTKLYEFGNYEIGISKPGKEVFSNTIKYQLGNKSNNPNDMTPTILFEGNRLVYDGSFEAIFKQFVRIHNSIEALQLFGCLLYRNAFLLDHKLQNGRWIYSPNEMAIDIIKQECQYFLNLPIEVFLYYIELIAINEDIKYHTLGYDISKGYGRKNNLLTYANVIHILLQKHHLSEEDFLLSFMSFAGRLTSPPSGLNPISSKKAILSFPQLAF